MKTILFFIVNLFVLTSNAQVAPFIIGGSEVESGSAIAQRVVLIKGKIARATFTCTGVIYSSDLILTAGHCLGQPGYAELSIFFGVNKKLSAPTIKVISQIRMGDIPTDSRPYDWQDLALLKLASPIPAGYLPAKMILDEDLRIQDGDPIILTGYGRTVPQPDYSGDGGLGVLRWVNQKILQINYGPSEVLVDISGGKGACGGDSGSPLFVDRGGELEVLGIASRLTERDKIPDSKPVNYQCTVDIVYTKISTHRHWIETTALEMMAP